MNTEHAVIILEKLKRGAQTTQKSVDSMLKALSEFYDVMGADTVEDLKQEWCKKQDNGAPSLYEKISILSEVDDNTRKKVVRITEKIVNFQKPSWEVALTREEAIELAHVLLQNFGITL